ncbi:hypothetical protein [Saccharopolyspora sp. 6M]|uniref:hypothetical protein n=1 Tax=Saccharopolyspora sp. 6M TaxID=2877237 RepID=UPI001CD51475|nr:hypothetical protein [Saccharopolyspora sp. 6M]MCA1229943.1 hypothetical protein [Saccharopolyspora sp. 6M]
MRISTNPDAIRQLTAAVGSRLLPDTYVQDGTPVVVEAVSGAGDPAAGDDDVALPLAASPLRVAQLAGLLAEHTHVVRPEVDKNGSHTEVETSPARDVLSAVLARRSWPELPVLHRIISTPVLRPDGTLLQTPGYDPETGFLLAGRTHLEPVPDQPTRDDVEAAREFLLNTFLRDFPWKTAADRANYLALLATPILRPFTRALSPFGIVDATMPGSGKTILSGCAGMLSGQRVLTWTDSDEELRKSITSVLADQTGVVVFDNLEEGHVINSAVLARLVTERTWTDRKLGTNSASSYANDRLWLATGNNLRVGGDMASRSVWVRLDPDCPRPEARTGFTIPNLDSWILQPANQAVVLRHLLILILDWTAAGAPTSSSVPQMRQFTRWAQHLGGWLEHHGIDGFLANSEDNRALDDDGAEWRAFLLRWHQLHGDKPLGTKTLRATADDLSGTSDGPWQGTFPTTANGKLLSTKSLGRKLTGQVGRGRGDIVLRSVYDTHASSHQYWVERQSGTP